ncbi:helix-turn-helix domain-containing protein [Lewinella sp. JB7]|uniref:helix-turn-helix domain-containing protein n=1 Tax=Lewinella sp. JB7 TaxID=2962887 RepID=UPI0020C97553|nr:helix-turn-helix domain-containing protein [Lewinella sp. JB7]MCP9234602.1 helix-turn-helix domain-containing protein [Lewinella sp. JB7]
MATVTSSYIRTAIELLRDAERHGTRQFILSSLADWRNHLQYTPRGHFRRALLLIHGGSAVPRSVRQLSIGVGISERQLQRIFRRRTGVTPKTYLRFSRFERAFLHLHHPFRPPLSSLADQYGYTDAAHLIREFRAFAGTTPRHLRLAAAN